MLVSGQPELGRVSGALALVLQRDGVPRLHVQCLDDQVVEAPSRLPVDLDDHVARPKADLVCPARIAPTTTPISASTRVRPRQARGPRAPLALEPLESPPCLVLRSGRSSVRLGRIEDACSEVRGGIAVARDGIEYLLWRHALADGEVTTMYAVRYPRRSTRARVVHFPRTERLDVWCRRQGVEEAVVGGFFLRDPYRPLGELWIDGRPLEHEPVAAPYAARRAS